MLASALLALAAPAVSLASPLQPRWTEDWCSNANLRNLAQTCDSGRYFGTAFTSFYAVNESYSHILDTQFSQYTPENEMKWEVIEPEQGVFNWTGADLILQTAAEQKAIVRGHNFCWNSQTPDYVTNLTDPTQLKAVLKEHVDAVLGRYGSRLYAFDVINEPLNDNGTIKESVWSDVLGEDYIEIALRYAHAAAPNLKLYINDYNIESVNNKSMALQTIAKGLLDKGAPLHGIGFESHFIGGEVPQDLQQSMKLFTDMGLDVAITELDIRYDIGNATEANSTDLAQQ